MTLSGPLAYGFGAVLVLLVAGSLASIRFTAIRSRVVTWWRLAVIVGGAMALGAVATAVLFAFISFVALREYLSLVPTRREDRPALLLAYVVLLVSYAMIAADLYEIFLVVIPVYAFLALPAVMVLNGRTDGYLAAAGIIYWGLTITVFTLGHAPLLMHTPATEAPAGGAGLLFLLLLATALNDVAQYIAGRTFGGPKIVPKVSPNKTWSGFCGGFIVTAGLIVTLAPVYTGLPVIGVVLLAVLLPVAGFAGDVTMSAVKRDLGVKDSAKLLPGHGGALDRLDSLAFTAPLYFHIVAFFASERF